MENISDIDILLPKAEVDTLSPIRTFWEKATLIHVECNRGRLKETPDRLSRHWYDLALLTESWVGEKALGDKKILEDVVAHKSAFFNASYADYNACLSGGFKLIPSEADHRGLKLDYQKMVESGMFSSDPPSFDKIIQILTELENKINSKA